MSDLNDIFEIDPLSYTTGKLDALIAHYRERRTQYKVGGTAPKEKKEKIELKLDDLKDLLG